MTTLADISGMLKQVRSEASLSQNELARRAGVARTTVARMETLAKNDMSVSVLVHEEPWRWPCGLHSFFRTWQARPAVGFTVVVANRCVPGNNNAHGKCRGRCCSQGSNVVRQA